MNYRLQTILTGAVAAAALTAGVSTASAEDIALTASSSHPPILPWVSTIKNHVVPESNKKLAAMGSKYRIKWTEAYAGSLYNFQNTLEGIEEGLGDVGWVGTLWEAVKMPLHNVAYNAPFAAYDVNQLLLMQRDLEHNFKPFQDEWKKHNTVFLGEQVADSYQLMTKKPIKSVDDVKGMKLIAAGAIAALTAGTGAIPVDAGLPVFYNNLKTGVADGAIILTTGMIPFKLQEVAPYISLFNFGAVISGALAMNADTWKRLPRDVQKVMLEVGKEYGDIQTRLVQQNEKKGFENLPKMGATMYKVPDSERKRWAMALDDVAGKWAADLEAKGIPARALLKEFMTAARKTGGHPLRDWK